MAQPHKYTANEATQLYLDRLKKTDPSPAVQAAIEEIEDELEKARPTKNAKNKVSA